MQWTPRLTLPYDMHYYASNMELAGPINRSIAPLAHSPMYVWHKYWGRKTWNVVGEYIKNHTEPGETVFDPFAGSGVAAIEALRNGRKAIICDLNPVACEIARLTILPVDETKLMEAFRRVERAVKQRILDLYLTKCRSCGTEFPATCFVWERNECVEVRYKECPNCEDSRPRDTKLMKADRDLLKRIDQKKIDAWYPRNPLYYTSGHPFKEKQHFESLDEIFTRRNLMALAWLMEAIEEEPSKKLRAFLKIAFSSMVHLCSKMCPALDSSPTNHQTAFSSTWNQHSYWSAPRPTEQNVWEKFEGAMLGHQGLIKAKEESNTVLRDIRFARNFQQVFLGEADVCIIPGDCIALMKKMTLNCGFVDYIFTDPPYDAAIQYGELGYLWAAWLKMNDTYTEKLESREIIRNERQGKPFEVYRSLLKNSFDLMSRVLKPGRFLTVTFHNPTFKVRNATIHEAVVAGFHFQNIHHQPLAQTSGKSMLQPFGSAQGDFYMRFHKPLAAQPSVNDVEFDAQKFERVVIESTKKVIAERAEPTPYTIIINYIDPQLALEGYWKSHPSGLDVEAVLKAHINKEFCLMPAQLGGATGQLWWLNDERFVRRLMEIPLSERVEQTIYRLLKSKGRISFTDAWNEVSIAFPNSLTSDTMSIKGALEVYARKVGGKGEWMLKPEIETDVTRHNLFIERLAWIGKKQGYEFWIGRREQSERARLGLLGAAGKEQTFGELLEIRRLEIDEAVDLESVANMDVLWLDGRKVIAAFEVEATTAMTSALLRGSNLAPSVAKYMLIPEERAATFEQKRKSPLFAHHFDEENWGVIYFDAFDRSFDKHKEKVNLPDLVGKQRPGGGAGKRDGQALLFGK